MKTTIIFLVLCCWACFLQAQLTVDFSGGSLQGWSGDSSKFNVANGALRLADNNPGSNNQAFLALSAPTGSDTLTQWEFYVALAFSPSTANFAKVYLAASQADLNKPLNGYYIQVGGTNADALQLYRQDGTVSTVLLNGRTGGVGSATVNVRVRVSRDTSGMWTLETDYAGGRAFVLEATVNDRTHREGSHFGWVCRYSATRNKAFVLDDIRIDPLFKDLTPPVLLDINALTAQRLLLRFNEPVDAIATSKVDAYLLMPFAGTIVSATRDANNPSNVILILSEKMRNLLEYTCIVTGTRDAFGNAAAAQMSKFTYVEISKAVEGDVLISEIMADPTPALGKLPAVEYLELWNKSDKVIALEELLVTRNGLPAGLGTGLFLPNTFIIVCAQDNVAGFKALDPSGSVLGLAGFPSLNNAGDDLSVRTKAGLVLNRVSYTDNWYGNEDKAQGGWSLELVNANAPEGCSGNWRASIDPSGGTPGRLNSVNNQTTDRTGPRLLTVAIFNPQVLLLSFDEPLDPLSAEELRNYALTDDVFILDAELRPQKTVVILRLSAPLQTSKPYTLTVAPGIRDCLGNAQNSSQHIVTGISESPINGDLIVNEILFNPFLEGVDFIEIYNKSKKLINLNGLNLINRQKKSGRIQSKIGTDYLLAPGRYVAVSEFPLDLFRRYVIKDTLAFLKNDLPTLEADEGNITFQYNGAMLDSFNYSNKLHSPLLDQERGISLERLNFDLSTNASGNWHSAAIAAGGATPGYTNSQFFRPGATATEAVFRIEETKFSPDGDGVQDVLLLPYQTKAPGYLANIQVFDSNGRAVKRLARNESLAAEGILKWDGTTDELQKARIGVYIVWIELFEPKGNKALQKLTCVLAGRL